jgi:hypothetical protein
VSAAAIPDSAAGDGLIFQWERRGSSRWRLALMLLLSLLAHAASFYALQVAYTPTGSLLPPPAQVMLVPPNSPENIGLEHWIDMEDPSLMTQPQERSAEQILGTLGFHYVPSYATVLQVFKPLPAQAPAEAPPQTRKPGPVPAGLLPPLTAPAGMPAAPAGQKPVPSPTRVVLSGGIQALVAGSLPPVPPPASRDAKPLDRTVFLVGVPAGGGPAWLFQQASSGDTADKGADADARDYLARLRFKAPPPQAGAPGPAWGWATFYWGRDAYPP